MIIALSIELIRLSSSYLYKQNESHRWLLMKWQHFGVTVMDSFDEEMCALPDNWIG